jgi:hypothetical protein
MYIVIRDEGNKEYLTYLDTPEIYRILAGKPMGRTETANIIVPVKYYLDLVEDMLLEHLEGGQLPGAPGDDGTYGRII